MLTAYISPTKIVNLEAILTAEWLDGRSAVLAVTVAGRGFSQPNVLEAAEPFASALWRQIQPAADPTEAPNGQPWGQNVGTANGPPQPAPQPQPQPVKARNAWGNGNGNGTRTGNASAGDPMRSAPAPAPQNGAGYSPGYRSGNGGGGGTGRNVINGSGGPPTRASQLFPWAKKQSERGQVDLVGYLEQWGAGQGFQGRFRDWSDREVAAAVAEAELFMRDQDVSR